MPKLTQAIVKAELSKIGVTFKKTEYGDYRVNPRGGTEETAYYGSDLEDAFGTGLTLAKVLARKSALIRFSYLSTPDHVAINTELLNRQWSFGGSLQGDCGTRYSTYSNGAQVLEVESNGAFNLFDCFGNEISAGRGILGLLDALNRRTA